MKILIVRHGDPNYEIDGLTERGKLEAELLSERLVKENITAAYTSPLGRARLTAEYTMKKLGREAEVCEWLQEFLTHTIVKPNKPNKRTIAWDWLPEDWTEIPEFYDKDKWYTHPVMTEGGVEEGYREVAEQLDRLIEKHGYKRHGNYYLTENANEDTIVFFCHFGLECVLLSHLLGISPMPLWHNFCAAPTSVTTVVTEERRKGKASFRMWGFGDVSHLYAKGVEQSRAALFCETYENFEQRHD